MLRIELTFRNLLLLLCLLLAGYVMYRLRTTVVLLSLALMLMATLHPFVRLGERHGLSHARAVTLVMVCAVLLPIAVIAALTPLVIQEVQSFAASFPTFQHHINELLHNWGLADQVNRAIDRIDLQSHIADIAVVGVQETISVSVKLFTIVVIGAYLLSDGPRLRHVLHEFVPRSSERHIEPLLEGMERIVGGYIRGQILTSALFGVYAAILCFALGVPNALLLGIIAAIGDIIPLFGVPAAMAVTCVVAFISSVWQPIGVVVGYVIYGQFESHFLVPRIYSREVNMSPLLVIIATIAGGALDGFIGIFIAIPVVGAMKVVLDYIVAERRGGREAASAVMETEATDPAGRVLEEDEKRETRAAEGGQDELDGVPAPTYSPFEPVPKSQPTAPRRLSGARYATLAHLKRHRSEWLARRSRTEPEAAESDRAGATRPNGTRSRVRIHAGQDERGNGEHAGGPR